MVGKKAVLMLVLLSLGLVAATLQPAQTVKTATIDFSGLAEGYIVKSLSVGMGISMNQGEPINGWVTVFGFNPKPLPDFRGANHAMIFDATCSGGCTGGDNDLYFPELGNGLIISEDHDSSDPDDADVDRSEFRFDFSNFGPEKVDVNSLIVADADDAVEFGEIKVYRGGPKGILVNTVFFEPTANNQKQEIPINTKDIDYMVVDLGGSGMIDNIEIVVENGNGNGPEINLELDGTCYPPNTATDNMKFWGTLKRDGDPIANHEVTLKLPNGDEVTEITDGNGDYSYTFVSARDYIGQDIIAKATVDGLSASATLTINEEKHFAGCSIGIKITLSGKCHPPNTDTDNMKFSGTLTRDGDPIANHEVTLSLPPDGKKVPVETNDIGYYEYIFEDDRRYIGQDVTAVATVDGVDYSATHTIKETPDFDGCGGVTGLVLTGKCYPPDADTDDLLLEGTLEFLGVLVPNHPITLDLPDGIEDITLTTDHNGEFSYLFEGADQYLDKKVTASTILNEGSISDTVEITSSVFDNCKKSRDYVCHNVFLYTSFGQPIELGSHIPSWGIKDVHVVCKGIGQGKSCRIKVKGEPGYVVKSSTLEMDVPRLLPHVNYQAQIKGYDGAWTDEGCEFSFITGGHVASISTHLSDQVDPLGWISLGEGQSAIKPLGVCSGWSDACQFTENVIGFHLDDIYGNQLPGSKLSLLQPGDRISIYRDHRLYTYEFTGSERVRQSAEGNQAILDAAKQHDLVLTTCSGYRLIDEGGSSHTRLATFTLLPRVERLYLGH